MKRILSIALGVLVFFVLLDFALHRGAGGFAWSGVPGFFALFGLIGCVAIVLISKWLGHYWLQRKEDYYDRKDNE